jgi:anti-sigma factor RsiW
VSSLSDKDRDDLVAYLDGELDEQESRALEARLNVDPAARAEAESLRKTWELLDYLPRAEPSATFTNRTLEKLAVQHTTGVQAARNGRRWPRWLLGTAWAAGMVVAAAGGLGVAHLLWSGEGTGSRDTTEIEEVLIRHSRAIENQRVYEPIDNLDFLRELGKPDLFGDDESGS